ncbi:hypothetical protein ACN4EK_28420 [Pantanalinema rosaneae CENA516]|uniref:hypothetical protein n=1 Tax=Pantanalinema rosaneae TaxID=1620701 RepID=UPI003D6FA8F8
MARSLRLLLLGELGLLIVGLLHWLFVHLPVSRQFIVILLVVAIVLYALSWLICAPIAAYLKLNLQVYWAVLVGAAIVIILGLGVSLWIG